MGLGYLLCTDLALHYIDHVARSLQQVSGSRKAISLDIRLLLLVRP